jgi:L-alanine-DL-glutamate epimerase-like enolase superfamily enzyme
VNAQRRLRQRTERWTLVDPFVIAGLVQADTELIVVEIAASDCVGRGECERDDLLVAGAPNVIAEIERAGPAIERGAGREDLLELLPAGPARSAIDCALWDLESRLRGEPVWAIAELPEPQAVTTAYTLRAASPARMAEDARRNADRPLLKLKLDGASSRACIEAVRAAAPDATLIADANGSLDDAFLPDVIAACERHRISMLEQPLPRGRDARLASAGRLVPLCADESFHDRRNLRDVIGNYDFVNVKLDKTGGLTEALFAIAAAKREGLRIMVGCMLGTSLAMAPAFLLAALAEHVDLDGPLMLGADRPGGMRYERSTLYPPEPEFWG